MRQPGDLGVLREVFHGFSEEARTRGFPSPPFGGFGFVGVASDLSIVAGWQNGSRPRRSALGHKQPFSIVSPECPLSRVKRTFRRGKLFLVNGENLGGQTEVSAALTNQPI